jgi:hypothetical protein
MGKNGRVLAGAFALLLTCPAGGAAPQAAPPSLSDWQTAAGREGGIRCRVSQAERAGNTLQRKRGAGWVGWRCPGGKSVSS